jgi:Uma2 family endonuclease
MEERYGNCRFCCRPPEAPAPVIIALTERVTEKTLIALAGKNPEYRFETTADGRLVVSPLTGFFASGGEAELGRQIGNWNAEKRLGRVTSSSGGFTLADGAIKGPDAAFVSLERIATLSPKRKKRSFEKIAPTLYSSCFLRRTACRTRSQNAKSMWRRGAMSRF